MLFSDLIDYLKNEKTFNIILNCSTDLHEIRDVELLDGTQTRYATDIVYFGYPNVLSPDMQPSQCADAVFSDSLLIDLRYDIPVKTGVTAQQRPAA